MSDSYLSLQTFKKKWEQKTIFFYFGSVCFICYIYNKNELKRCSGCKLIAYCSIEHQKMNWSQHKSFCNVVKQLLRKTNKSHLYEISQKLSTLELNCFKVGLKNKLEIDLGRVLSPVEYLLIMFPRLCFICLNTNQTCLIDCENCLSVSYCGKKHMFDDEDFHKTKCSTLKLNFEYSSNFFNQIKLVSHETFNINVNKEYLTHLPNDLPTFVTLFTHLNLDFIKLELAEELSVALTIIYILQTIEMLHKRLITDSRMSIHIIGAGIKEVSLNWPYIVTILSKWILNLERLEIFCIGPECGNVKECKFFSEKIVLIQFYPMLYHEFLNIPNVKVPNLNIAFNCGFHEYKISKKICTWQLSLPLMVHVPLAFTSYTCEEALEDMRMVQNCANNITFDVLLNCSKNFYRGLKPIRDWEQLQDCFYTNNYISIIKPNLL